MNEPLFTLQCTTLQDMQELLDTFNRAANTWEPARAPKWLIPTADRLQKAVDRQLLKQGKIPGTRCELGCVEECLAKLNGCASECPALPWQPGQA